MDLKRNMLDLIIAISMVLHATEAIHSEIEELIEYNKLQQQIYGTTTDPLLYGTETFQPGGQSGRSDSPTGSVCKYMGDCGGPASEPCPSGSACRIKVGWCCKTNSSAGTESSQPNPSQQKSKSTKLNKQKGITPETQSKQRGKPGRKTNVQPRTNPTPGTTPKRTKDVKSSKQTDAKNLRIKCNGTPVGKCGTPTNRTCPANSKCSFVNPKTGAGICCRTKPRENSGSVPFKVSGRCPNGQDGVCGTRFRFKCRSGTTCGFMQKENTESSGKCCIDDPREAFCPSGDVQRACSSYEPCERGYTCRYGFCCREDTCPENWINGGNCKMILGAPKCPNGYKCINGFCCRIPEVLCPSGILDSTCSLKKPCKPGYMCRFGNCCRN
ncbi:uncharacterized protein K04H4.2-like [Mercenaria mercenaria]|uniref:uncharacterized protein K04H4.2-like n=1 Tax=Mercenaria mercenaria TaxID=6596 RepID=UPI00234F9891|nr:uncharacterized protein K04H4.2-like [Mercenaria mercenaria]